MTMRTNPNTGDVVSLLGYGMMRLPMLPEGSKENPQTGLFDQDMINRQVDYALEHGVNYFDTAPVYCRGLSERCTGIALKRHPRDKYFIATKLSNFDSRVWPLEESKKMFENSDRKSTRLNSSHRLPAAPQHRQRRARPGRQGSQRTRCLQSSILR